MISDDGYHTCCTSHSNGWQQDWEGVCTTDSVQQLSLSHSYAPYPAVNVSGFSKESRSPLNSSCPWIVAAQTSSEINSSQQHLIEGVRYFHIRLQCYLLYRMFSLLLLLLYVCLMLEAIVLLRLLHVIALLLQIYRTPQQSDANRHHIMMSDKLYLLFYIHMRIS